LSATEDDDAPTGTGEQQEANVHPDAKSRTEESPGAIRDGIGAHLDRSQLVAATSLPVPRARLSRKVTIALWVLRVVVCLLSAMVIYTFVVELH
jgi:hypothetical protein